MEIPSPRLKATFCTLGGADADDCGGVLWILIRHETAIGFPVANRTFHPRVPNSNEPGPVLWYALVRLLYTHTFIV